MVLNNLTLVESQQTVNISVKGKIISDVSEKKTSLIEDNFQIDFDDAIAFPGLINSHDHLDFNCFPILNERTYNNYTEWGKEIHKKYKNEINEVLKIPQRLRAAWGMYKNLLAGVTTVVNHGPVLNIKDPLITIRQEFQCLHSVKFEYFWQWKLNNPFLKDKECVIHTGEGTDIQSSDEIDKLLWWNFWKRKLIGIHGVAMNPGQAKRFHGLVWCPESNRVLLNKEANIERFKNYTRIVLGTDSTLTGNWNAWHHLRSARLTKQVSDLELYEMVTRAPSKLWNCHNGDIRHGRKADIVIAKGNKVDTVWDRFYNTDPDDILMVIHKGKIRLIDADYFSRLKHINFDASRFFPVKIKDSVKYVEGNLPVLINDIKSYYPKAVFPCSFTRKLKNGR